MGIPERAGPILREVADSYPQRVLFSVCRLKISQVTQRWTLLGKEEPAEQMAAMQGQ